MEAHREVRIHSILFGPPSHAQTRRARGVENNTAHITLFMLRVPEYVCTAAVGLTAPWKGLTLSLSGLPAKAGS